MASAPFSLVEGHERPDVYVREGDARDDYEHLLEVAGEALDTARGAEKLVLPVQVDLHAVSLGFLAVRLEEGVSEVVDVHVDLVDVVPR